jgi:hypothetical protein
VPTAPDGPWSAFGDATESDENGGEPLTPLIALADFLSGLTAAPNPRPRSRPRRWYCPLPGGGAVELDDDPARAAVGLGGAARAG